MRCDVFSSSLSFSLPRFHRGSLRRRRRPAAADPLRHGHALLIGNSNYDSWPRLDDIPLQLDELAAGLKRHFDTVEVVKDLKIEPLRQKINGFLRSYGNDPNARLFIYYAVHGYTEPILQYNEYRGYITGIDTPALDGSQRALDTARPNAMSMMEIRVPLAEVLAKHILIVFDSCFAGTIFLAREGNAVPLSGVTTQPTGTKPASGGRDADCGLRRRIERVHDTLLFDGVNLVAGNRQFIISGAFRSAHKHQATRIKQGRFEVFCPVAFGVHDCAPCASIPDTDIADATSGVSPSVLMKYGMTLASSAAAVRGS
jgi:hypothetical protein